MMQKIILLLMTIIITGCNTIEHNTKTEQPIGTKRIAGVGDVVLRVNKQRSLKNAFGKADVFGRKTNEGYAELRYAGVENTGEVVLYRKDTRIVTNETTMSRTPISVTTGTATTNATENYYGNRNYGNVSVNSRTSYSSTTYTPPSDYHVVVPVQTIPIRLAPGETNLPMEGYVVEIIKASPNSLEYRITKY